MNKLFITLIVSSCMHYGHAQVTSGSEKFPFSELTIEPAVGTRLNTFLGNKNVQLSNLIQYNLTKRVGLITHSVVSSDFKLNRATDVRQQYNIAFSQRIGIGTSFSTRRASNAFFVLAGLKFSAYSGTLTNEQLPERLPFKTRSVTSDYGLMYNLKLGREKYFFSGRIYVPLKDGVAGIVENANLEFGVGIRLK